ncbi:MAG: hypothetical protein K8T20_19260 [Planctomycetes bacterium]|nr:hypothetical protein [Planctomycetota bacterium]
MKQLAWLFFAVAVASAQEPTPPVEPPKPPPDEAADLLKKIEDKFLAAADFSVKVAMDVNANGKGHFDVIIKSKATGLFKLAMDGKMMDHPAKAAMNCDGKNARMTGDRGTKQVEAGADTGKNFVRLFILAGVMPALEGTMNLPKGMDLAKFKVTDAKVDGEEEVGGVKAKVISYVTGATGSPLKFEVKVWVDPVGLTVLKREMKDPAGNQTAETYSEWKTDQKIADTEFAAPGK